MSGDDDTTGEARLWAPGGEMSRVPPQPDFRFRSTAGAPGREEASAAPSGGSGGGPTEVAETQQPASEPRGDDRGIPRRHRPLVVVGVVVVALVAVIWSGRGGGGEDATETTTSTRPSTVAPLDVAPAQESAEGSAAEQAPIETAAPATVGVVEPRPIGERTERDLDIEFSPDADFTVVAHDAAGLVHEVDVGAGTVISTTAPPMTSDSPAYLFESAGGVVAIAYDSVPGFELGRDGSLRTIGADEHPSGLLRQGPFLGTVWEIDRAPNGAAAELVGLDGTVLGNRIDLPEATLLGDDGRGNLVVAGTGGVYAAGLDSVQRLTVGEVLALGSGHVLARECDEQFVCGVVHRDLTSGDVTAVVDERVVAGTDVFARTSSGSGTLSPDGRIAHIADPNGVFGWAFVDLGTGEVTDAPAPTIASIVWSPDSRFAAFVSGALLRIYDRDAARMFTVEEIRLVRAVMSTSDPLPEWPNDDIS